MQRKISRNQIRNMAAIVNALAPASPSANWIDPMPVPDGADIAELRARRTYYYALGRNADKLQAAEKAVLAGLKDYEAARIALCESFADKDDDGKAIIDGNEYRIPAAERGHLDDAVAQLRTEHAVADYMAEEIDVDLHCVAPDAVPANLPAWAVVPLMPMIDESMTPK